MNGVAPGKVVNTAMSVLFLCLLSSFSFARTDANNNKDSRIVVAEENVNTPAVATAFQWSADRKLTWDDFKGAVDYSDDITAAATYCGIGFESEAGSADGPVYVKVYNRFFPSRSWVKAGQLNSYILAHEQCHFDICELYTRILRKKLNEAAAGKNVTAEQLKDIYAKVQSEYTACQEQYEQETAHGTIDELQQAWEYKVAGQLKDTES